MRTLVLGFSLLLVGCQSEKWQPVDSQIRDYSGPFSPSVLDAASRARSLHDNMCRADVEKALMPCVQYGGDLYISGIVANFYSLAPDASVGIKYFANKSGTNSPDDIMPFTPKSLGIWVNYGPGKKRQSADVRLTDVK